MNFHALDQYLNVDAYYAFTFFAEALFAIWILRIRSKVEKHQILWEEHNKESEEEAQLKEKLLSEYQVRDRLQTEHITRLSKELGYYKGRVGVPLNAKPRKKKEEQKDDA